MSAQNMPAEFLSTTPSSFPFVAVADASKRKTKQSLFFSIGSSQVITFFHTGNIKLQAA
jgi:hypothetical protein